VKVGRGWPRRSSNVTTRALPPRMMILDPVEVCGLTLLPVYDDGTIRFHLAGIPYASTSIAPIPGPIVYAHTRQLKTTLKEISRTVTSRRSKSFRFFAEGQLDAVVRALAEDDPARLLEQATKARAQWREVQTSLYEHQGLILPYGVDVKLIGLPDDGRPIPARDEYLSSLTSLTIESPGRLVAVAQNNLLRRRALILQPPTDGIHTMKAYRVENAFVVPLLTMCVGGKKG
jgi:hypothetical protein